MSLFDFLKGHPRIQGTIGYFGLADWWVSEFTESERQYIQNKFQPLGSSGSSLTKGQISSTSQTAIGLLSGLAGWFSKSEDRHIAYKLIAKAESLIDDNSRILDVHFLYGAKIEICYKDRDRTPQGLDRAIEACEQQITYASRASRAFKKEYEESLPSHKAYQQLAIIREKLKEYSEAIRICEQALQQGWTGDWEKRIERCKKKRSNA